MHTVAIQAISIRQPFCFGCADDYEIIQNELIESPDEYSARMQAIRDAKDRKRKERKAKLRLGSKSSDTDDLDAPDDE